MTSRRDFVKAALATGGALTALPAADALAQTSRFIPRANAPLNILILGGTGFIGPHQVRYAVARGHKVAVFNRGRRQADLPSSVEHITGDRNAADGLAALKGRNWDVVIDNPTTRPIWVRQAAEVLKGHTKQYIFISTISVYPDAGTKRFANEDEPVAKYTGADAFAEAKVTLELYGPLKAVSEQESHRQFPGMTTVIRPGLIVGPGDDTDRFSYWPVRIAKGGEVLVPGDGQDAIQFIDVRDLTEWTIRTAEERTFGTFNATGPKRPYTTNEFLYGVRAAVPGSTPVELVWVPEKFLETQKVGPWVDMPLWLPRSIPDSALNEVDVSRAVAKGLTFRSIAGTARDTLDWWATLPADRTAKLRSGLPPEREAEVLAAWKASRKG